MTALAPALQAFFTDRLTLQRQASGHTRTRELYHAWDHALLRLAGVVQPPRVTGAERPADIRAAVTQATREVIVTGDQLLAQIRSELQSGRGRRRRILWIPRGRSAS
ncbi:MAG TPA: hypothetical protein VK586_13955 [Streptosporangiaceae bacterium]|nr:hypothetical protein [Streptosporangiaceae bacterium]